MSSRNATKTSRTKSAADEKLTKPRATKKPPAQTKVKKPPKSSKPPTDVAKKTTRAKTKKQTSAAVPAPVMDDIDLDVSDVSEASDASDADDQPDQDDNLPDLVECSKSSSLQFKPVVRQTIVYLHPNNRRTSDSLTAFEHAEAIGLRAVQIQADGFCLTDTGSISDPIKRAEKEFADGKCPWLLARHITPTLYELWDPNQMATSTF